MAQAVTADLEAEQTQPTQKYYRHVELLKRYWDSGTGTYKWDTATNIDAWVIKVSPAMWKLDTGAFNEWKSPNFQIEVDNRYNAWAEQEAAGVWQTGANEPYVPELSRVRVRTGHILEDGTEEDVYVFGGIIGKPIAFNDEKMTANIYVVGMEELLNRVSAEDLSQTATDELLGSDSGTEFTTDNNGVGIFVEVKKGSTAGGAGSATALEISTDYSEADKNEYTKPGKLTLVVALSAGESLWATYKYWYQDKEISWAVEQLLILAGITDYSVDPTIFASDIENTWVQTTQADFEAGVLTDINTTKTPDSFQLSVFSESFDDGDYSADPAWTITQQTSASVDASSGALILSTPAGAPTVHDVGVETPASFTIGVWRAQMICTNNGGDGSADVVFFQANSGSSATGYGIAIMGYSPNAYIVRYNGGALYGNWYSNKTLLADLGTVDGNSHSWKLSRDVNGVFVAYKDGTQVGTVTDLTYTTFQRIGVALLGFNNHAQSLSIDDICFLPDSPNGTLVSQVLDSGIGLSTWGTVTYNVALNNGTILIETLTSKAADFLSNNDPAGWVAISLSGQIQSLAGEYKYLKVRVTLTPYDTGSIVATPVVSDFTVKYYTSATLLPLLDFSGMDCYTAIRSCASLASYEIGFNSDDSFFYRARTTSSSPVVTLSVNTNLIRETSFNTGRDRIYNRIEANFGDYKATVDCDTEGESRPHSIDRDGVKSYSISGSLLPKEGVNIAVSAAATIYAYTAVPRRRASVEIKYLMQLELGDVATYQREHKFGRWTWGDGSKIYGGRPTKFDDFIYYDAADLAAWDYNMRIEGIEFDTEPNKCRMRLELVENI